MSGFVEIRPLMQQQVLLTKTGTVTIRQNMSDLSTNQDIRIPFCLLLLSHFSEQREIESVSERANINLKKSRQHEQHEWIYQRSQVAGQKTPDSVRSRTKTPDLEQLKNYTYNSQFTIRSDLRQNTAYTTLHKQCSRCKTSSSRQYLSVRNTIDEAITLDLQVPSKFTRYLHTQHR